MMLCEEYSYPTPSRLGVECPLGIEHEPAGGEFQCGLDSALSIPAAAATSDVDLGERQRVFAL